jgi:CheY-like chemotaxis protein
MTAFRAERILAVDDDPGMRRVLSRTLSPPYEVQIAGTSAEARERLARARSTWRSSTSARRRRRHRVPGSGEEPGGRHPHHPDPQARRALSLARRGAFSSSDRSSGRFFEPSSIAVSNCSGSAARGSYARELAGSQRARRFRRPRSEPVRSCFGGRRSCEALGGDFFLRFPGRTALCSSP